MKTAGQIWEAQRRGKITKQINRLESVIGNAIKEDKNYIVLSGDILYPETILELKNSGYILNYFKGFNKFLCKFLNSISNAVEISW